VTPDRTPRYASVSGNGAAIAFVVAGSALISTSGNGFIAQLYVQGPAPSFDPGCDVAESAIACSLVYSGGVGPLRIRWYVDGVARPSADDDVSVEFPCVPGNPVTIVVSIADLNGPAELQTQIPCVTDRP
jgi:hypothetical protein